MKPVFFLLISILAIAFSALGEIPDARKRCLDSIVSAMDLTTRKDLELAHTYMDSHGTNDEEKVWLFYGYLGTYFKYDKERLGDMTAPFYNPELTTRKSKGVCRDFSRVFEYLCIKSHIPCFSIMGKTKTGIFFIIKKKIHHYDTKVTHQWNVVRVNGTWMFMDPTWTHIESKTKITVPDPKSKTTKTFNLISVSRRYYNPSPEFVAKTHAPIHPAFSLLEKVPTFKTIRKAPKKQQIYQDNYPYEQILDSIWHQKNTVFSHVFVDESFRYSSVATLNNLFHYELDIALVKPDKKHPASVAFYDERITRIEQLTGHIQRIFGVNYTETSRETIEELQKRKKVLEKQLRDNPKRK